MKVTNTFCLMLPLRYLSTCALGILVFLAGCDSTPRRDGPQLSVVEIAKDFDQPWDIAFTPEGDLLITEKCVGLSKRSADGKISQLVGNTKGYAVQAKDWFCEGQSGVHGVAIDPQFAGGFPFVYVFAASDLQTRDLQASDSQASDSKTGARSNRISRFRVDPTTWALSERADIVSDIAFKEHEHLGGPGAHSGGRIRFGNDGYLWITTGDNHDPSLPQDPKRLGGKVLRVDRDGRAAPNNNAPSGFDPRIYSYGHRNPQGIAMRPNSDQVYTAEHGPNHSDEINRLSAGGNYGWDPQNRPDLECEPVLRQGSDGTVESLERESDSTMQESYCGYAGDIDSMPMTDRDRFPNAIEAVSNNDGESQGTGPIVFLEGAQWGEWNGALAVGVMRELRLDLVQLDANAKLVRKVIANMPDLRLRSLVQSPQTLGGELWAITDDGVLLRIGLKDAQAAKR
jgi:aldose sugar dehydrogenase